MTNNEFRLPDVGEGLTEAEIVTWAVQPGDTVQLNQVICEIETEKSLVEIPSPFTGEVAELLVETGTTVPVGTPILRMLGPEGAASDPGGDTAPAQASAAQAKPKPEPESAPESEADSGDGSGAVLVGYGTGGTVRSRRRGGVRPSIPPIAAQPEDPAGRGSAYAKPPVRKLAKDLGIALSSVAGSGALGEVLRDDVRRAAGEAPAAGVAVQQAPASEAAGAPAAAAQREERIPVKGIRKVVAAAMVESKFTAPHTSVFVEVDVTRTVKLVNGLQESDRVAGLRVAPLGVGAAAVVWARARHPDINSRWAGDEIIRRNYVNLGIAAATPRGLVVPNVKDAQRLSLRELAEAIGTLTTRAREGRTQPAEMQGGTITITNVGVFGVDFGLPILNPGETAIVAVGAIREKPWVVKGKVRPRMVATIGGSFDHRVIDGDVMSGFVADVAAALERPQLLLG